MIDTDSKFTSIEDILNWPCTYIRDTALMVSVLEVKYTKEYGVIVKVNIPNVGDLDPKLIEKLEQFEVIHNNNYSLVHSNSIHTGMTLSTYGTLKLENLSKTPYGTEMGNILYGKAKK